MPVYSLSHPLEKFVGTPINEHPPPSTPPSPSCTHWTPPIPPPPPFLFCHGSLLLPGRKISGMGRLFVWRTHHYFEQCSSEVDTTVKLTRSVHNFLGINVIRHRVSNNKMLDFDMSQSGNSSLRRSYPQGRKFKEPLHRRMCGHQTPYRCRIQQWLRQKFELLTKKHLRLQLVAVRLTHSLWVLL
jgi:hypothetical protein